MIDVLIRHVEQLAEEYGIKLHWTPHFLWGECAFQQKSPPEVYTSPILCECSYLTTLHEIAHCVLQHPRPSEAEAKRLIEFYEAQAWNWAFTQSIVEPTEMMRFHGWCDATGPSGGFESYLDADHVESPEWPAAVSFVERMATWLQRDGDVMPGMVTGV